MPSFIYVSKDIIPFYISKNGGHLLFIIPGKSFIPVVASPSTTNNIL